MPTIGGMHESMDRLYKAVSQIKNVTGQTPVATLLGEKPQTVNNWESRGISLQGAMKAQAKVGCSAHWLLTGEGGMFAAWPFPKVPIERFLALDDEDRGYVQIELLQAIEYCEGLEASDADHAVLDENVRGTNRTFRNKRLKKLG